MSNFNYDADAFAQASAEAKKINKLVDELKAKRDQQRDAEHQEHDNGERLGARLVDVRHQAIQGGHQAGDQQANEHGDGSQLRLGIEMRTFESRRVVRQSRVRLRVSPVLEPDLCNEPEVGECYLLVKLCDFQSNFGESGGGGDDRIALLRPASGHER